MIERARPKRLYASYQRRPRRSCANYGQGRAVEQLRPVARVKSRRPARTGARRQPKGDVGEGVRRFPAVKRAISCPGEQPVHEHTFQLSKARDFYKSPVWRLRNGCRVVHTVTVGQEWVSRGLQCISGKCTNANLLFTVVDKYGVDHHSVIRCFDKDIIVVPESNRYMCSRELQGDMYRRKKYTMYMRCFRVKEL